MIPINPDLPEIVVVWLKRDLRFPDHAGFAAALHSGLPVVVMYVWEPEVMGAPDWDERHTRFVRESVDDMNGWLGRAAAAGLLPCERLSAAAAAGLLPCDPPQILEVTASAEAAFDRLAKHVRIHTVFSHQEIGTDVTWRRDRRMKSWFAQHRIGWQEFPTGGVIRALRRRSDWNKHWYASMGQPVIEVDISLLAQRMYSPFSSDVLRPLPARNPQFQPGGTSAGLRYLASFLHTRIAGYRRGISKPGASRTSCGRISPYLAWGNVSSRQVWQAVERVRRESPYKRDLTAFASRLRWRCHFIQKLETAPRMEFENVNRGFNQIRQEIDTERVSRWERAQTGYPLVDACMRCVQQTGYLNFRMRAMLVSFLTHHLWQPWQSGVHFLARMFLDYEPGIHYSQFQMQASTTGVNTIRIYNPVKQSHEHDPDGAFIRQWIPALSGIPGKLIHEPWKLSEMEQVSYGVRIGVDYPAPVVDVIETYRYAGAVLWSLRGNAAVQVASQEILGVLTERRGPELA